MGYIQGGLGLVIAALFKLPTKHLSSSISHPHPSLRPASTLLETSHQQGLTAASDPKMPQENGSSFGFQLWPLHSSLICPLEAIHCLREVVSQIQENHTTPYFSVGPSSVDCAQRPPVDAYHNNGQN